MSEETYIESKTSLTNIIKKKRKNLMGKKWRREVKQQIENENLFKRSKEKALFPNQCISSNGKNRDNDKLANRLRNSIQRIRRELIQDDSDDEVVRETENYESSNTSHGNNRCINNKNEIDGNSYDSNPLQKIIEQRKLESSTDSEESEEELDDDYDIGIDDIELDTEENEEDHEKVETEDEDFNILTNSYESKELEHINYHKQKLKETLGKNKGQAPFTDVIEKGIQSHLYCQNRKQNNGSKKEIKVKETKAYDYNKDGKESRGGARPSSQLSKRQFTKGSNKIQIKGMQNAINIAGSFD